MKFSKLKNSNFIIFLLYSALIFFISSYLPLKYACFRKIFSTHTNEDQKEQKVKELALTFL